MLLVESPQSADALKKENRQSLWEQVFENSFRGWAMSIVDLWNDDDLPFGGGGDDAAAESGDEDSHISDEEADEMRRRALRPVSQ